VSQKNWRKKTFKGGEVISHQNDKDFIVKYWAFDVWSSNPHGNVAENE